MSTSQEIQQLKVYITANNSQLLKQVNQTNKRLDRFQRSTARQAAAITKSLTGMFAIAGVGAMGKHAISTLAGFEFQMDKVAAISGATQAQFKKLEKNALELGAASQFTATEIAQLQEELARLGFSVPQITAMTDAARKLAQVADVQLAEAAKVVGQQINAFGLSARDATNVANVMAESFSKSALNLEQFSVGMSFAASAGKSAGFSIEQVTAMLGALVDAGIQGSKAGTALRDIFADLSVKGISLEDALNEIEGSTNKNKTAFDLFGKTSMNAAIVLAESQEKVIGLTSALSDNVKELDNMTEIMEDNLLTDWAKFESAMDGIILKGGPFNGALRSMTQSLTFFANALAGVDDTNSIEFLEREIKRLISSLEELNDNPPDWPQDRLNAEIVRSNKLLLRYHQRLTEINREASAIKGDIMEDFSSGVISADQAVEQLERSLSKLSKDNPFFEAIKGVVQADLDSLIQKQKEENKVIQDNIEKRNQQVEALKEVQNSSAAIPAVMPIDFLGLQESLDIKSYTGAFLSGVKDNFTLNDYAIHVDKIIPPDFQAQMDTVFQETQKKTKEWRENMLAEYGQFANGVDQALKRAIAGTADAVGSLVIDKDLQRFYQNILKIMAEGIRNMGQLLIAQGNLEIASKLAPPPAKIAIGAAAIAVSAAISAASNRMGSSVYNGGSSGGSGYSGISRDILQGQSTQPVQVEGEVRIDGSDLVIIIDNENAKRGRGG